MLCCIFSISDYILFLIKHISSWRKKSLPYEAYNLDMTSEKSCLTLCDPMDCTFHGITSPWNPPEYWSGQPFLSPEDLPNPRIEPGSPTLQVDSLPAELQGKSKNTREGSLSLLQGNLLTQESHWGLLHCRRILCQQSYEGSP